MIGARALSGLLLASALPLLGGCVAAALPVVAGAVVAKKTVGGSDRKVDPKVAAPPEARVTVFNDGSTPRSGVSTSMGAVRPGALPSPNGAPSPTVAAAAVSPRAVSDGGNAGYSAFVNYALAQAMMPTPGTARRSALVDPATLTSGAKLLDCSAAQPAVLIDLDPGPATFDLADAPLPSPGLAAQLAALRRAGLTVLWSAALPVKDAQRLWTVLQASGLDPDRTDRLLLLRKPEERKQERRLAAARDWCIVAMAGDRPGDFEEALDYLRDPDGPIAQSLKPNFGAGWFISPPPIQ